MNMAGKALPAVLLVEPQFVLRRTIVTVARELGLVEFHEATSVARAMPALASRRFVGVVIDIGEGPEALAMLARLRDGGYACAPRIPVIAMTSQPIPEGDGTLDPLWPVSVLRKPFKIGALLESVKTMAAYPAAGQVERH